MDKSLLKCGVTFKIVHNIQDREENAHTSEREQFSGSSANKKKEP